MLSAAIICPALLPPQRSLVSFPTLKQFHPLLCILLIASIGISAFKDTRVHVVVEGGPSLARRLRRQSLRSHRHLWSVISVGDSGDQRNSELSLDIDSYHPVARPPDEAGRARRVCRRTTGRLSPR